MTPGRAIPVQLVEPLSPERKGGGKDPEWVKVGAECLLQRYGWRDSSYTKVKIVRITATRVVLDDRFNTGVNRDSLSRYSGERFGGTSVNLVPIDDPRARAAYYTQWRQGLRLTAIREVEEALAEWKASGAASAVDEAIEALTLAQARIVQVRKQEKG